jgi:hypothetical protein
MTASGARGQVRLRRDRLGGGSAIGIESMLVAPVRDAGVPGCDAQ